MRTVRAALFALACFFIAPWGYAADVDWQSLAVHGPQEIPFRDQATLKLPAGYLFIPQEPAIKLMEKMGNSTDANFMGLILSEKENENWMVVASYEPAGYIKDDDAKDWDADELLKSLTEGTEAENENRIAKNIAPMEVVGWAQTPQYEATTHRLLWSVLTKDKGAPAGAAQGVNYNTYALGREGYISLNLVTDAAKIQQEKAVANTLLSSLTFKENKRYQDFTEATDKVAEYGLAALVAGVAAKKLGFLALVGVFFAKFFKLILLAGAGVIAAIAKFFGKKSGD